MAQFGFAIEDNLFAMHQVLRNKMWRPDPYEPFFVTDPKRRHIHKATVRDRVLHQALYRKLYPIFDKTFIHDSYSSRVGKGTHAGVSRLEEYVRKTSANYSKQFFALKCDVQKFFDSIDHIMLLGLIRKRVRDRDVMWLIESIVGSFGNTEGKGLPLGNVTSQLFANVYLDVFDQFVKRELKVRYYIRYCDDFVILGETIEELGNLIPVLRSFLKSRLLLRLHPNKISIRTLEQGLDFLGYVVLPRYRVLRTRTKQRIIRAYMRKAEVAKTEEEKEFLKSVLYSYKGMLIHCRGYWIWRRIDTT